jgi:hypothetical protein
LFSSAQSLGAGLFPAPFLPDNCVSGRADAFVLVRRLLGLQDRYFGAGWLVGLLGTATRQLLRLEQGQVLTNLVSLLAAVTTLLSVAMMAVCARRSHRECGGLGKSLTTLLLSSEMVVVYYGILVVWFWHMMPIAAAHI